MNETVAKSPGGEESLNRPRRRMIRTRPEPLTSHASMLPSEEVPQHQAELFYMQKQIQAQTQMVIVLEDGEKVEGCIEWYDRNVLKVRGKTRTMVYKSSIKYMHKLGEND
jgi:sRNA-binding regulator protein Hfq